MTWWLSEVAVLFSLCGSILGSLKLLKKICSNPVDSPVDSDKTTSSKKSAAQAEELLIIWVMLAAFQVYALTTERLIRWIPGYYYAKAAVILILSVPQIRISRLLFWDVVVPSLRAMKERYAVDDNLSLGDLLLEAPVLLVAVCFPGLLTPSTPSNVGIEETAAVSNNEAEEVQETLWSEEDIQVTIFQFVDSGRAESRVEDRIRLSRGNAKEDLDEKMFRTPSKESLDVAAVASQRNCNSGNRIPTEFLSRTKSSKDVKHAARSDAISSRIHESTRRLSSLLPVVQQLCPDGLRRSPRASNRSSLGAVGSGDTGRSGSGIPAKNFTTPWREEKLKREDATEKSSLLRRRSSSQAAPLVPPKASSRMEEAHVSEVSDRNITTRSLSLMKSLNKNDRMASQANSVFSNGRDSSRFSMGDRQQLPFASETDENANSTSGINRSVSARIRGYLPSTSSTRIDRTNTRKR